MVDTKVNPLLYIHDALIQEGFSRVFEKDKDCLYHGVLDPKGAAVPISFEVKDFNFVRFPEIKIRPEYPLDKRKLPHVLGSNGSLCYLAKGSVILDRYNPGGTVLQCLNQATTVLLASMSGNLDADFADEFSNYWGTSFALVDMPPTSVGKAGLRYVKLAEGRTDTGVLAKDASWLWDRDPGRENEAEAARIVSTDQPLTLDPALDWPPKTLGKFNEWLSSIDPKLVGQLENTIASSSGTIGVIAIRAPNGIFICRTEVPQQLRRVEFLKNRRLQLPKMLRLNESIVDIELVAATRADAEYVFGRNLGEMANLRGKHILLIGCGTIGGFLAQQLAQCGAGFDGGSMVLVDNERLQTANLGRHLLGTPYLHLSKAEACVAFLKDQLPPLDIKARDIDALELKEYCAQFDIVVDATGEEALSIALNEAAVAARPNSPPHLFVWLEGNGATAKSMLTGEADFACLKCLKPSLSGPPRYRTLRPGVTVEVLRDVSCADAGYVPYPVSRSVSAAALACDHILDWANGNRGTRFRTRTFDTAKAFRIDDCSPSLSEICPACGVRA